jgi:hypothetical protein
MNRLARQAKRGRLVDPDCVLRRSNRRQGSLIFLLSRSEVHMEFHCDLRRYESDFAKTYLQKKSFKANVISFAWCSYIYLVWQDTNRRNHESNCSSTSTMMKQIIQSVQFRILTFYILKEATANSNIADFCSR